MNANSSYKLSFTFALILHVTLLIFLLAKFVSHNNYALSHSSVNIVKAVMVTTAKVPLAVASKESSVQRPINNIAVSTPLTIATKEKPQIQIQKSIEIKKDQEKKLALIRQKQIKAAELKAKQELEQKQANMRELMQKTMHEELVGEEHQVAAAASSAQAQGEIDKYKALIIQSIAQYWIVPDNVGSGIYCKLAVRLGPGGEVLRVELIRESGNEVLDRSAKTAVLKASPLPVPEKTVLFDNFRELTLTVRPEGMTTG
jgi:colicin import membrane protein